MLTNKLQSSNRKTVVWNTPIVSLVISRAICHDTVKTISAAGLQEPAPAWPNFRVTEKLSEWDTHRRKGGLPIHLHEQDCNMIRYNNRSEIESFQAKLQHQKEIFQIL